MNEELDHIRKNNTWELVPQLKDKNVIGRKWVFKNKLYEDGEVTKNKEILVCKSYEQAKGLDFQETFSPVTRMGVIMMFLSYVCLRRIKVYQIDVMSMFLNGELEEEAYIEQSEGFMHTDKKDYVCRLKKAFYGLKKAPSASYARIDRYL